MDIKNYRNKELPAFLIGCTLALLYLDGKINLYSISGKNNPYLSILESALVGSIITIFAYIFDALVSTKAKDEMVFLGGIIPQAGQVIFDKIQEPGFDKRFTVLSAEKAYRNIIDKMPTDKAEKRRYQNEQWNQIYNNYRKEKMIEVSNRDYLMSRDIFISTGLYVICYLVFCLIAWRHVNIRFLVMMLCLLVFTRIGIGNKARALVSNVIAKDLQEKNKTKTDAIDNVQTFKVILVQDKDNNGTNK